MRFRKSYPLLAAALVLALLDIVIPAVSFELSQSITSSWSLVMLVIVVLIIAALLLEFEEGQVSAKQISLIAMLGTISATARVPFAAIPSVQPCTYLIICSGAVFGPTAGFMVGAVTAAVSNIFLGQGPWTVFQILGWGLAGLVSGVLFNPSSRGGALLRSRVFLAAYGILWGYLFGWILNIWHWITYIYPLTWKTFLFTQATSFGFDTMHALGNAVFLLVLGPKTIAMLTRYKKRFEVHIIDESQEGKPF